MNELIKVNYDNDNPTVSGRELHEYLDVETPYHKWFPRMCEYGFAEGIDFCSILSKRSDGLPGKPGTGFNSLENERVEEDNCRIVLDKNVQNPKVGRPSTDHQLTIDMAKELCMIQRNEKGKQARQYFLNLEKAWNTPEMIMSRALRMAESQLNNLRLMNASLAGEVEKKNQIIGELRPKADYVDWILKNKGTVAITQIAKDYGMSGNAMNRMLHDLGVQYKQGKQWLLYRKYHASGYTHSETVDIIRSDGRPDIEMYSKWTQKGRLFLYELLKDNGVLPMIEQDASA